MRGTDLRNARQSRGWTQKESALRLHLSQSYVSMLERNRRTVPQHLLPRLLRAYRRHLAPTAFPLRSSPTRLSRQRIAGELGSLGYPGYAYLQSAPCVNPAELLLTALDRGDLETRSAAGLTWLVLNGEHMNWQWVIDQARVRNLQNRVGFVLSLARQLAISLGRTQRASDLARWERVVEQSRLAREDTFAHSLTEPEKRWLREHRSDSARHWNLLTDLSVESLSNA